MSRGYLPRTQAIKALRAADILYLAVRAPEGYNILPGRIFDYLVSRKPVVGLVSEDSSADDLLKSYPGGYPIYDENILHLRDRLVREYEHRQENGLLERQINFAIEPYSTQSLARKYAAILKKL